MSQVLQSGSLLQSGKYIIKGVLGQGGFGITYLAEQVSLHREVAIKEFFIQSICDRDSEGTQVHTVSQQASTTVEKYKQKFLNEANTISGLHHPNIISIFDVFEENDTAYYVMEYINGGSLQDIINEKNRLPESDAIDYITHIANAVDYLHSRRINHYDIKPANILIRQGGTPVLIDFGISKIYDDSGNRVTTMPVGISDGYAPIEQYSQEGTLTFSPQADIYSLGATLYKLVTGQTPPSAPSRTGGTALTFPGGLKESTKRTIESSMALVKGDRLESASAFSRMLTNKVPVNDATSSSSSGTGKVRTILIAIIGLLVIGIGALLLLNNNKSSLNEGLNVLSDSIAFNEDSVSNTKDSIASTPLVRQDKSYAFKETFGDTTYSYSVKIYDGRVTWSLKCPGEKYNGSFNCNPELDPEMILNEFKGVIYWAFACKFFCVLTDDLGYYRYDEYQWAKRSFSKSASYFGKARQYCPSAYKKVQSMYNDLVTAENSVDALWEEICILAYALGEYPIEACDLYECDY